MSLRPYSIALLFAIFAGSVVVADAAPGDRKRDRARGGRMLNRFDHNKDGKIEGQEAERLRRVFASLAALDTDRDGTLSDAEVSAAKVAPVRRKKSE